MISRLSRCRLAAACAALPERAAGAGYRFAQLAVLAAEIEAKDKQATFTSLGLSMDWNGLIVQAAYARRRSRTHAGPGAALQHAPPTRSASL